MNLKCLNCGNDIENNFCSVCGQKTSTHRFSLKHFVIHDIIHGVFHLDKGFLFTIKELFTRPGHSIREYVQGKRVKHFNYFTLLLLIITVEYLIRNYSSGAIHDQLGNESAIGYYKIFEKYHKLVRLMSIPIWALITWLFFKKSKQTFLENIILNAYMTCGYFLIYIPIQVIPVFFSDPLIIKVLRVVINIFIYVYIYWFIYQYFSVFQYKKYVLLIRSLFTVLLIIFLQSIIFNIINNIGKTYFH